MHDLPPDFPSFGDYELLERLALGMAPFTMPGTRNSVAWSSCVSLDPGP